MIISNDEMPYRKKAKKRTSRKSNHKHCFQSCIFTYEMKMFNKDRGYVPTQSEIFGKYCSICGKISFSVSEEYMVEIREKTGPWRIDYTDKAKRELDPATRTLRTFFLEDFLNQRYVDLRRIAQKEYRHD